METDRAVDKKNCGIVIKTVSPRTAERKHFGESQKHITQFDVMVGCEIQDCPLRETLEIDANLLLARDESATDYTKSEMANDQSNINIRLRQLKVKKCPYYSNARDLDRI